MQAVQKSGYYIFAAAALILPAAASANACVKIPVDAERLRCYDQAFGHAGKHSAPSDAGLTHKPDATDRRDLGDTPAREEPSLLARAWELDPGTRRDTLRLVPHRANYILPLRYSDRVNATPDARGAT